METVTAQASSKRKPRVRVAKPAARGPSGLPATTISKLASASDALKDAGEAEHDLELRALVERANNPLLRVVIFGQFSRGKSTLINALLGRLVLPAKAQPTTGHVTQLIQGTNEEVRVRMNDGSRTSCSLEEIDRWAVLDLEAGARKDVESIEIAVDCPLLKSGMLLMDTPGVQEADAQTERAVQAVALADLVLLVFHAGQLLHQEEQHLALDWMKQELGKPLVPVVNWMQSVEPAEREELRARMDRWCAKHLEGVLGRCWYEVDALAALKHAIGEGPAPSDDFYALARDLSALVGAPRARVQQGARRHQLQAVLASARSDNAYQLTKLQTDRESVQRERAEERGKIETLSRRLTADIRLQREALAGGLSKTFTDARRNLIRRYEGKSKETLDEKASGWFGQSFSKALKRAEEATETSLLSLCAQPGLRRPEPMTVVELMELNARVDVDTLQFEGASGTTIGGSAVAGAVAASFIPIIGTVVGGIIGGVLGAIFGSKAPDYASAYSEKTAEVWAAHEKKAEELILGQFDARVSSVREQVSSRLSNLRQNQAADGAGGELSRRQTADRLLADCERLIHDSGHG